MRYLIYLLLLIPYGLVQADIAIIGNLDNGLETMTLKEVKDVYMGRSQALPNGDFALPLDQHELRPIFYDSLTGRKIELINAYWARIIFSGQASPPLKVADSTAVINVVSNNKGAIGYIDMDVDNVDEDKVRILLILK